MPQDVVTLLNNSQHQFDLHMKQVVGVNPQLMMPGNYARVLFDEENSEHILKIIFDDKDRENMSEILRKFRFLHKVYRAHHPEKEDVSNYKMAAIEMGSLLVKHFDFAQWPNYLHRG